MFVKYNIYKIMSKKSNIVTLSSLMPTSKPSAYKKARIPKVVKEAIWNKKFGNIKEGHCYCCYRVIYSDDFQAGHIVAESKGGATTEENLKPICKPCNVSVSTHNMDTIKELRRKAISGKNDKLLGLDIERLCGLNGIDCDSLANIILEKIQQYTIQKKKEEKEAEERISLVRLKQIEDEEKAMHVRLKQIEEEKNIVLNKMKKDNISSTHNNISSTYNNYHLGNQSTLTAEPNRNNLTKSMFGISLNDQLGYSTPVITPVSTDPLLTTDIRNIDTMEFRHSLNNMFYVDKDGSAHDNLLH
jgi:hypothetical protein